MNCREASIRISLHVGDDLPASEVPALEAHLEHCAICEAEYESYAGARDALFLLKDEVAGSTDLWQGIEAQLDLQPSADGTGGARRPWYRHPLFVSAMAAALLIGVTSPLWRPMAEHGPPVGDLVEHALLPAVGASVLPVVDFGSSPEVESVPSQETLDFLDRNQGRGLLDLDDSLFAVPVSNPNRGAY